MKAIILSAGRGMRLRPLSDTLPKALIDIEGKALIEYSLEALSKSGIKETIIVIGYLGSLIKKVIGNSFCGMTITYVSNEDYLRTGTMFSFYKAESLLDDDILLIEADLLYHPSILGKCIMSDHKDLIVVSEITDRGDEVLVSVNRQSTILAIGKKIAKKNIIGEFIGISKLSKKYCRDFFDFVTKHYFSKNILNGYYEDYFVEFGNKYLQPMSYSLIDRSIWTEIDNEVDIAYARNKIFPNLKDGVKNEKK